MAPDHTAYPGDRQPRGFSGIVTWLTSWEPRRRPRRATWRPVEDSRASTSVLSLL